MNTHDKYELPPLPKYTLLRGLHTSENMQKYARAAIEADRSKRMAALEARHEEAMFKYDKTKESYHEGYADALDVAIQIISGELWK